MKKESSATCNNGCKLTSTGVVEHVTRSIWTTQNLGQSKIDGGKKGMTYEIDFHGAMIPTDDWYCVWKRLFDAGFTVYI